MSFSKLLALSSAMTATVLAANAPLSACTSEDCGYCPTSITSNKGYPSCVIYYRDTVLGEYKDSYQSDGKTVQIYWDIPAADDTCRIIIRTPASVDEENCGFPVYAGTGDVCQEVDTSDTVMIQFCCGTGDCNSAGVKRSAGGSSMSAVFHYADGTPVMPLAVGHDGIDMMEEFLYDMGINSTSLVGKKTRKAKRDCDSYTQDKTYTSLGTQSYQVSGEVYGDGSSITVQNSNSVSHTTTFSASIGDPWGIVSASVGFEDTKTATQSVSYDFQKPDNGQMGHVSWTPIFDCSSGTIHGCDDGDQDGEVCHAKPINGGDAVDGVYSFVVTG